MKVYQIIALICYVLILVVLAFSWKRYGARFYDPEDLGKPYANKPWPKNIPTLAAICVIVCLAVAVLASFTLIPLIFK